LQGLFNVKEHQQDKLA